MPKQAKVLSEEQLQRKEETIRRRKEAVAASQDNKTRETIERILKGEGQKKKAEVKTSKMKESGPSGPKRPPYPDHIRVVERVQETTVSLSCQPEDLPFTFPLDDPTVGAPKDFASRPKPEFPEPPVHIRVPWWAAVDA
uniref:INO80 complex subunit B-like conserved region domain-containing protein n=1 Tax=Hemiselmis andersenii TaxID=464988 RepID=A0A6T8NW30_HEMAN|mmetsp:Transcript_27881/g.68016  ORF Transcript_27881/g.68016 Transcript_27881/m.68016 type:complete len:139 (+) Transcript_27881:159-575(+)